MIKILSERLQNSGRKVQLCGHCDMYIPKDEKRFRISFVYNWFDCYHIHISCHETYKEQEGKK